ncbi:MAG: LptF/LptG family permease [Bacteroidales bacterium]|uniref:LptF/LptG family permease n=1 Tax=Candidatus Cryptobacteroides sp. TaxID=2952915 RepID=UPI002A717C72|nr:LptF/LptG family permease [Candidatus Cryptobacteroides sp.]MBS7277507.1 LptF/LptG family permease [Bacteroidales bacterium]MCI6527137.1 LptF/LptG family permease [Bacteroidales bacterium]MDD5915781.1 LptF/LptG family permease [Bacteroidales bacterium]MDD6829291.1 LptF/LptG family permease [Bacteroidales bacterium]MDD7136152.1 LptF/LptG family permease [Bacteroidales bacterium]
MLGLKKIDWYIIKKFISTFFIALMFMIVIVIIFDISEKVDNFVSKNAPLKEIIFDYYCNWVPYFMNMFSPLFVFITVIFFTSRMAANTEIIAILSCGVSYRRMMVPYFVSAFLIFLLSLSLNLWIIPRSNITRIKFENTYIDRSSTSNMNVHYQISPGTFVFVESFSSWNNTCNTFTLEEIRDNKVVSKLSAEKAVWDSTKGCWHLRNYFIRDFTEGLQDHVRTGRQLDTVINLTITDFYRNKKTVETLAFGQLNDLIRTQQMRGDANVMYAQIEKHTRFALPFSAFILTIMGVSLSSRKRRGGIGLNIGVGIALSFTYILFLKFSQMFVYSGALSPAIALWLPNVLFGFIAAFLYYKASR